MENKQLNNTRAIYLKSLLRFFGESLKLEKDLLPGKEEKNCVKFSLAQSSTFKPVDWNTDETVIHGQGLELIWDTSESGRVIQNRHSE